MAEVFDHNDYSTIIFIDSMVALECKPLEKLPWSDLDNMGRILVMVVPQVNTEIDKRKRDGRLGKRAREFNRIIAPAAESGIPEVIIEGSPQVSICIARCSRIDWNALDDLDPQEGDHKVVAQILHAVGIPNERKTLLSEDTNPIFLASSHGLSCRKLPKGWLLDPEPHPKDKDVTRLTQRVRELEDNEPKMDVSLSFGVESPFNAYRVTPLDDDEKRALTNQLVSRSPRQEQARNAFNIGLPNYDDQYSGKHTKYTKVTIPTYVARLHKAVENLYAQFPFYLEVKNLGNVQAEELIISIKSSGGSIYDKLVISGVFPPFAPQPDPHRLNSPHFDLQKSLRPQRDRHEVAFIQKPDHQSEEIQFQCSDFRHGRTWSFDGVGTFDPHKESPFSVTVEITAANIRGIKTFDFALECSVTESNIPDLVDLDTRSVLKSFSMAEYHNDAISRRDFGRIDFSTDD